MTSVNTSVKKQSTFLSVSKLRWNGGEWNEATYHLRKVIWQLL